jgi:DNA-binding NarL/FixJ family response regulator
MQVGGASPSGAVMADSKTTVIVEDEILIAAHLRKLLDEAGIEVVGIAASGEEAIKLIRERRPAFILMDVRLEGALDGVDVAFAVHEELPDTRVIYITAYSEPGSLARIYSDHPHTVMIKPIDPDELLAAYK